MAGQEPDHSDIDSLVTCLQPDADKGLRAFCDCGKRIRVLWSGPIGPNTRPVLLVCHFHPQRRCQFEQAIPADAITRLT